MLLQPGSFVHLPGRPVPLVSIMTQVGKPRGQGRITFASGDPRARPHIESAILDDPIDLDRAVSALQLGRELVEESAMRKLARPFWPPEPVFRSPAAMRRWIRYSCDSGYHPAGTVPMGKAVDSRGRVFGVENLIVADASIMPTIPSSNLNLPTLMLGERFGEWLAAGEI